LWPKRRSCGDAHCRNFPLSSASLDIRQNSRFHDIALSQIIGAADGWLFIRGMAPNPRLRFLNEELFSTRPSFCTPDATVYLERGSNATSVMKQTPC
jgi:phosphoenolpyruvate carboxylase